MRRLMRKIGAISVRYNNAKGFLSSLRIGRDKEKFELGEQFFIRAVFLLFSNNKLCFESGAETIFLHF